MRQEYLMTSLSETDMDQDPVVQFQHWFEQALHSSIDDVNAMTLSTADMQGIPSSRIVLLKGIQQGQFVFYTNYQSRKGRELESNPQVSLNFYWKELQRQVRIAGPVSKTSAEDSEEYFASRPLESQLGAWASHQSEILDSRAMLEARFEEIKQKYRDLPVPKPPHWGGFAVDPVYIEFWQGRANRLHDRICYQKQAASQWLRQRLNP
ncbi:MAG: pyridoxamine 5'-phosphate oxidase [Chitinophagaceae bacterium]|nr:pyridoxamine 5'-phosphate oxidase [Chitinophagaceae bacterium]